MEEPEGKIHTGKEHNMLCVLSINDENTWPLPMLKIAHLENCFINSLNEVIFIHFH